GLSSLSKLKELLLANNLIHSIEDLDIAFLEQLEKINLSNNPITGVSIRDWGNKEVILGYLSARALEMLTAQQNISTQQNEDTFIPNKHIKLNIIGDGRIGKTQLLNVLCGKPFIDDAPETHGMNHNFYHTEDDQAT